MGREIPEELIPHGHEVRVAAHRNRVRAIWGTRGTGFMESGPLVTAFCSDEGATWRVGSNPADDGSTEGHGFIDVLATGDGFHAVWLDGRDGTPGLRYARSVDGLSWEPNVTIDAETCECCWNVITSGPPGSDALYVLYRDRAPRDMSLAVSEDGGRSFRRRSVVGEFDWNVDACPHVGGGLVAGKDAMHSVVWTGSHDAVGLHHLGSRDGGSTWNRPRRLGDENARHADIASNDGRLAVVWDATVGGKQQVMAAFSGDAGRSWTAARNVAGAGRAQHHPRIVAAGEDFVAFWSRTSSDGNQAVIVAQRLAGS